MIPNHFKTHVMFILFFIIIIVIFFKVLLNSAISSYYRICLLCFKLHGLLFDFLKNKLINFFGEDKDKLIIDFNKPLGKNLKKVRFIQTLCLFYEGK